MNVNLEDGQAHLSANVKYSIFKGNASMDAEVETINGVPSLTVKDVNFGMLPISKLLKDKLMNLIPQNGLIQVSNLPFNLQNIQIKDGQIIMEGVTK